MLDLDSVPGLIFVLGALMPLLGCVLIALASFVHGVVRPLQGKSKWLGWVYQIFGGDQIGYASGVIATLMTSVAMLFGVLAVTTHYQMSALQHEQSRKVDARPRVDRFDPPNHDRNSLASLNTRLVAVKRDLAVAPEENRAILQRRLATLTLEREAALETEQRLWNRHEAWIQVQPMVAPDAGRATVLSLGFKIDGLSALLFLTIALVSLLIHIYSLGYMDDERQEEIEEPSVPQEFSTYKRRGRYPRYFLFLGLFTFAMLHLVIADNLLQVFLSWELVGLGSYFLIGFWYEREAAANAATKAFLFNRVGDAGFLIAMAILWSALGTLSFDEMAARVRAPVQDRDGLVTPGGQFVTAAPIAGDPSHVRIAEAAQGSAIVLMPTTRPGTYRVPTPGEAIAVEANPAKGAFGSMSWGLLTAAGLCLFLGAIGKSAQGPLYTWLPDAMEGPTPVSALIHAATMVAAGVYLVARVYPLLTPEALLVIAYVGLFGMIVGAVSALATDDIKRILAFSTISQLGLMFVALGVGGWSAGLFHLTTHAFIKALLFLGAGVIIQTLGESNQRKIGGLTYKMPFTAMMMLTAVLSLSGMPFFAGWYSKDAILGQCFGFVVAHPAHWLLFVGPLVIAGVTAFYLFRMWILIFLGIPSNPKQFHDADEAQPLLGTPMMFLALLSICAGWGWVPWDSDASYILHRIHSAQPVSVQADFGTVPGVGEVWEGGAIKPLESSERLFARLLGPVSMLLALLSAGLGVALASHWYAPKLSPEEERVALEKLLAPPPQTVPTPTQRPLPRPMPRPMSRPVLRPRLLRIEEDEPEETPTPTPTPTPNPPEPAPAAPPKPGWLATLLSNYFYLDALYRVLFVVPVRWLGRLFSGIDRTVLDPVGTGLARATVAVARVEGQVDNRLVDGSVRGLAWLVGTFAGWLRFAQTGSLRAYVFFLVLAAVGVFLLLYTLTARTLPG